MKNFLVRQAVYRTVSPKLAMKIALTLPVLACLATLSSCGGNAPTRGEELAANAAVSQSIASRFNKGDKLEKTGLKQQEKGKKLISDGETLIKKGRSNVEKGQKMRAKADAEAKAAELTASPAPVPAT